MKLLGGEVLTTENAREFSSAAKGETLEDTIRTVEGYSDIIIMRYFESGAARRAASTASILIINAGDGPGQPPTQVCTSCGHFSLLDRELRQELLQMSY
ncbi:Aspartate carbamoyltransferase, chloroplastic [Capsicum chinense]|nr:Aspartate carbamoyltransferase, chloroplastic [Capsicum chinense]